MIRKIKNLWASWRFNYVKSDKKDLTTCVFCEKGKSEDLKSNYVIKKGKFCYSLLNIYPYNNGHVMVTPYRHVGEFNVLRNEEINEIMCFVKDLQIVIKQKMSPDGFNVGFNQGKAAGAGIEHHFHVHVIPRWNGDTSFMSTISGIEVIPESLDSVYCKLTG